MDNNDRPRPDHPRPDRPDRPKLEFTVVHTIKGNDGVEARISRAGDRRPVYSVQLGRTKKVPDEFNRLSPFLPCRIIVENGELSVDRSSEDLHRQAHDWIHEDAMTHESEYAAGGRPRDGGPGGGSGGGWGGDGRGPKTRVTGKTQRDREKKLGKNRPDKEG